MHPDSISDEEAELYSLIIATIVTRAANNNVHILPTMELIKLADSITKAKLVPTEALPAIDTFLSSLKMDEERIW